MKRLLLMTMLCCGLTAAAQNEKCTFSIKPLVGVNMTTLPGGLSDDYYHNKFGLLFSALGHSCVLPPSRHRQPA